ncbi:hypothetical protein F4818DRAFT_457408 [Hypoxylon cercidicola]|nr:hypothetical protein F4818DRAFT_457408 [Hypoxylon cercidicola]
MRSQTIVAAAFGLLSGTAAAQSGTGSSTTNPTSACVAALTSLLSLVPTLSDPALQSFVTSYASASATALATNPCAAATALPASLTSAAASYESQLASFGRAHAGDASSVASLCVAALPSGAPAAVSSALGLLTGYAGTTCLGTATATATATPGGAAARPTAVAARAAAAGLLGAGAAAMLRTEKGA